MRVHSLKPRTFGASALLALAVGVASGLGGGPTQEGKLTAADAANFDSLGDPVAVDGDTAVAGAYGKSNNRGAAYVFTRTGTTWTQQQKLTASDGAINDVFGRVVAVSGDTALVGAYAKGSNTGAAYVFTRTGTTWTEQQKLTPTDPATGDAFGGSVALEGDTAVVGAAGKSAAQGAVYVFTRTGTTWTQQAKLTALDAANGDLLGLLSVGLSGDTVVAGSYPNGGADRGAAYVFTRSGTTWSQQAKLTASDAANGARFGYSVALSGDTAAVGTFSRGFAYVFTRTGTTWSEQAKLTPDDSAGAANFGVSVSVAADAAVVGASEIDNFRGAAYVFTRTGTAWTQKAKLTAADGADSDRFGESVALDGDTAVAGAYGKDSSRGAAYVFDLSPDAAPSSGHCLATKVKAKVNAKDASKSSLAASGALDTGTGAPDFSGAATFDVGGFHLDVPAFVAKGRSLSFSAGGITLKVTPAKNGSSRTLFSVKAVGDLTGRVDVAGPLAFRFTNTAHDLAGAAGLTAGVLGPHAVTGPDLAVLAAAATLKGPGRDALKLTLGFATDGVVPAAAEDLTVCFGGTFTSARLPAASFVRKGNAYVFSAKAPGITKASVDHVRGTISISGAGLDLGAFADGGNGVAVTIVRGADVRTVGVRMARIGAKLAY